MYPYKNMSSFKIIFDNQLPDTCEFVSFFKGEFIGKKDYLHALDILIVFKMNTRDNYHDFYLKNDVSLLADVFEMFIDVCLEYCGLNRCHLFVGKKGMK